MAYMPGYFIYWTFSIDSPENVIYYCILYIVPQAHKGQEASTSSKVVVRITVKTDQYDGK